MRVLGIETSCDETAVAIIDAQQGLLANQLYSQTELHSPYGGVVPELASRDHIRKLGPLVVETLQKRETQFRARYRRHRLYLGSWVNGRTYGGSGFCT